MRGCEKLCPGWLRAFLIFLEGVKSTSALAGWRNEILFEKLKQEFVTSQLLRNSDVIIAMLKKEQKILLRKREEEWCVCVGRYMLQCCTEPWAMYSTLSSPLHTYTRNAF